MVSAVIRLDAPLFPGFARLFVNSLGCDQKCLNKYLCVCVKNQQFVGILFAQREFVSGRLTLYAGQYQLYLILLDEGLVALAVISTVSVHLLDFIVQNGL